MRSRSVFWGVVLILVGGLFLADTLDLLGGLNPWKFALPLLLILMGVAALLSATGSGSRVDEPVAIAREMAASSARLTLSHGAGRILVKSGAQTGQLVSGTASGGIAHTSRVQDGVQVVKASIPTRGMVWFMPPFIWGTNTGFTWDLSLTDEIPLDLTVESGASETRLDLSKLKVTRLKVATGASDTRVTLPEAAGLTRAKIECGVASVSITVPEGVAARIESSSALTSTSIDSNRFPRSGGVYQSPDFDAAANRVEIKLEMGVGSVSVR